MDASQLDGLVARLDAGRVLFVMHANADPDCVGAAAGLQAAFGGMIAAPDGVSRVATRLVAHLGIEVDTWPHPEQFDTIVVVDTGTRAQLGRLAARVGDPCVVDHHRYGDLHASAPASAWDPSRASCCEVVLELIEHAKRAISPRVAAGLLVGLVADTAHFRHADTRAFAAAGRLLALSDATMEDVLALLDGAPEEDDGPEDLHDASRRKAVLLALQRTTLEARGAFLLAESEVGAFDAAAATALVRAGADVAVVANERAAKARLSMRASLRARAAGVDLGAIAHAAAGRAPGWSGGGHEGAAGMNGPPPVAPVRADVARELRLRLEGA